MEHTLIALVVGAALVLLDVVLHRSHAARHAFAALAGMIPRWVIWTVFLFAAGSAAHIASGYAMLALLVEIAVFGFAMLAWLSAADNPGGR